MMYLFLLFLLGSIFGSFLNALVFRIEKKEKVIFDRSKCPKCFKKLRWFELIPIFSFLIQKGKCRNCNKKISYQYPLVELVLGILFALSGYFAYQNYTFLSLDFFFYLLYIFFVIFLLFFIFIFDLKHLIIPNFAVYSLILVSLFYFFIFDYQNFYLRVLAGLLFLAFYLILYFATKGKGIGLGDVKLSFFIGVFLNLDKLWFGIFYSYLFGFLYVLPLLFLKKKSLKSEVPFGPFLVLGTLIAYFLV